MLLSFLRRVCSPIPSLRPLAAKGLYCVRPTNQCFLAFSMFASSPDDQDVRQQRPKTTTIRQRSRHPQTTNNALKRVFFPQHFSVKGPVNCEHEPRGRIYWESTDFRAERPRRLLLLLLFLPGGFPNTPKICRNTPKMESGGNIACPGGRFLMV